MEEVSPKLTFGDVFGYMLAYLCWIATAASGLLTVFQMRNALNVMWPAAGGSRWILRAVDRFGLVFMGLAWLVYVIFTEQHYRSAITIVRLRRHKERREGPVRRVSQPEGRVMRMLRRMGLDVLANRFLPTLMLPLVLFVIAYLVYQLGFSILGR
jgi:hypothetical protein